MRYGFVVLREWIRLACLYSSSRAPRLVVCPSEATTASLNPSPPHPPPALLPDRRPSFVHYSTTPSSSSSCLCPVWVGVVNPWPWLRVPRSYYKTVRDAWCIERMHQAFKNGLMQYGMIKSVKKAAPAPPPPPPEERAEEPPTKTTPVIVP